MTTQTRHEDMNKKVVLSSNPSEVKSSNSKRKFRHKRCFSYNSNVGRVQKRKINNISEWTSKSSMNNQPSTNNKPKYFWVDKFLHQLAQSCQKQSSEGRKKSNNLTKFKPKTASAANRSEMCKTHYKKWSQDINENLNYDLPYITEEKDSLTSNKICLEPRLYGYKNKFKQTNYIVNK